MEKVVLDEIEYVKASAVAKEFNYTADYIGQLCRGKKIDARLVGRSWFVNVDSLLEHKSKKYSSPKEKKEEVEELSDIAMNIKAVSPVLKSKTARSLLHSEPANTGTRKLTVSYEVDDESLIPEINKGKDTGTQSKPKTINVKAFDGKKLRVKGGVVKNTARFEAGELPDVALSGKLSIQAISDEEDESLETASAEANLSRDNHKNKVLSSKRDNKKTLKSETQKPKVKKDSAEEPVSHEGEKSKAAPNRAQSKGIRFSPESVNHKSVESTRVSVVVLASPLIASVVAILCVGILFSAVSSTVVTANSYQSGLQFQVANLIDLIRP